MPSTGVDRIDGNTTSVAVKAPCTVITTTPITLSGIQTIDGITLQAGDGGSKLPDRVLVNGQADATTNGIYLVQTGTWIRAYDFDGARDAVQGTVVFVRSGHTNGNTLWELTTTDNPINIYQGGSNISFSKIGLFTGLSGTSTTSNTVGSGSKSFTTQAALPFQTGQYVLVVDQGNSANYMNGQVTSYDNISGALVVNVTATGGSGTHAAWNIVISGPTGQSGSTGGFAGPEATLPSASTCDLGSTGVFEVDVTLGSSATINSFGGSASVNSPLYFLRFSSGITLANSSALLLPGRQNISTALGDCAIAKIEQSSTAMWRMMGYFPANGQTVANLPVATVSTPGVVEPDGVSVLITSSGQISVPHASSTVYGVSKVDGVSVTVSSGVLQVPSGSSATAGLFKNDGTTINASSLSVLSVPFGSSTTPGVLSPDGTTVKASSTASLVVQPATPLAVNAYIWGQNRSAASSAGAQVASSLLVSYALSSLGVPSSTADVLAGTWQAMQSASSTTAVLFQRVS